jgi:hypothetical protein
MDIGHEGMTEEQMQLMQNERNGQLVVVTDENNALQLVRIDQIPQNCEKLPINVSSFRLISIEERSYLGEALRLFGLRLKIVDLRWEHFFQMNEDRQEAFFAHFLHMIMLDVKSFSQQMYLFIVENVKNIKSDITNELRDTLGLASTKIENVLLWMKKIQDSTEDEIYNMRAEMHAQQRNEKVEYRTLVEQLRAELEVQKSEIRQRQSQSYVNLTENINQHAEKLEEKFTLLDAERERKMQDYKQMLFDKSQRRGNEIA